MTVEANEHPTTPGWLLSPAGLVTAAGFGATRIDAVVEGKRSTVDVLVTPPGTFAVHGILRSSVARRSMTTTLTGSASAWQGERQINTLVRRPDRLRRAALEIR